MKIQRQDNESIANALTRFLTSKLPLAKDTGLVKKLKSIHVDKRSKGKAVLFVWEKERFKITEHMKVWHKNFMNEWKDNDEETQVVREKLEI